MPAIVVPVAIGSAVAEELPKIFGDAVEVLREGEADYLRDGQPNSLPGKIAQAAGRSACRIYGTGNIDLNAASTEKYERACRPYLDDRDPGRGPSVKTPFPGGQCAGILYNVTYNTESRTSTSSVCSAFGPPASRTSLIPSGPVLGPIGAPTEKIVPDSNFSNRDRRQSFEVMTGSGLRFINVGGSSSTFHSSCGPSVRLSNFAVVRVDGQADNCGSPPPIVTQPEPIADPTPPPFRFNPDPFVDIDVDVDVDVDGRIIFNIGTGPITVDPFGGGGGGGGDSDLGGNDPVGGPGTSGGSSDTGPGGVDEGSADEGEELVGVLVQVLSAPLGANRFFNNSELVYRGAYYVAMGYPGRLGLDMSGGTAETLQFFHAQQRGLTNHRVRANVGFNLRVTPYYRILEP